MNACLGALTAPVQEVRSRLDGEQGAGLAPLVDRLTGDVEVIGYLVGRRCAASAAKQLLLHVSAPRERLRERGQLLDHGLRRGIGQEQ